MAPLPSRHAKRRAIPVRAPPATMRRGRPTRPEPDGEPAKFEELRCGPTARVKDAVKARKLAWPVRLFFLSQLVPWIIALGPMRMSAYRFVLMAFLVPCLIGLVSGKAGRIRLSDVFLLLFSMWCFLAIVMVHGFSYATQPGGIIVLETMGAYLLARRYIRDADDFYNMALLFFRIVAMLLPLAVLESVSSRNIAGEALSLLHPIFADAPTEPRWGLRRAQVIFEHPILFGVSSASALALTHLVLGFKASALQRWQRTAVIPAAAFFSLSSGPLSALAAQGLLLIWNGVLGRFKHRWMVLLGFGALTILCLEMLSNRSLPAIFISGVAFDEGSGRARLLIWEYGSQSALNHPLFGVGFNDWDHADWMSPSIDMFWIIDAVRHGIPAELFMLSAFFSLVVAVSLRTGLSERENVYRTAYLICMTGFFLSGWTVYFWNGTYVLFLFLLGSGAWLLDADKAGIQGESTSGPPMRSIGARRPPPWRPGP